MKESWHPAHISNLEEQVPLHSHVKIFIRAVQHDVKTGRETFSRSPVGKMFKISLANLMKQKYHDLMPQRGMEISYSLTVSSEDKLNSGSWRDVCGKTSPEFLGIPSVALLLCCLETEGRYVAWESWHSKHLTVASVRVWQRQFVWDKTDLWVGGGGGGRATFHNTNVLVSGFV